MHLIFLLIIEKLLHHVDLVLHLFFLADGLSEMLRYFYLKIVQQAVDPFRSNTMDLGIYGFSSNTATN